MARASLVDALTKTEQSKDSDKINRLIVEQFNNVNVDYQPEAGVEVRITQTLLTNLLIRCLYFMSIVFLSIQFY